MGETPLTTAVDDKSAKVHSSAASAGALSIQLIAQFLIGLWLARSYSATPTTAHVDVAAMHRGGIDRFLQAAHYWGSAILILHGILHVFGSVWLGLYRGPNRLFFVCGLLTMLTAVGLQMTGNVLPFDRHGVQTAGIEASIAARAPIIGSTASHLLLGGASFNDQTVGVWYSLHRFVIPLVSLCAIGCAFLGLRRLGRRPTFVPMLIPLVLVGLVAAIIPSPLGSAATAGDYGAFDAKVSWYVWPMHGAMRLSDSLVSGGGWLGAMALPGLLVLFLALLPLFSKRIPRGVARGGCFGLAGALLLAGVFDGGSFASVVGTRDPIEPTAVVSIQQAAPIDTALADQGRAAFNRLECVSCHGKDGKVAGGGPALTNVWKRHGDADYYLRYIRNPTAVQSDSTMPAFPDLSSNDLKSVAEYLRQPKS